MSEGRVTELDVTKQTARRGDKKKVSFWLSRAQTRLAYLATVSCSIQGPSGAPHAARLAAPAILPPFSTSTPTLIVNDESLNDYIWRWHKLIPASLAKSCSPPDYAKQAYILSL